MSAHAKITIPLGNIELNAGSQSSHWAEWEELQKFFRLIYPHTPTTIFDRIHLSTERTSQTAVRVRVLIPKLIGLDRPFLDAWIGGCKGDRLMLNERIYVKINAADSETATLAFEQAI